MGQKVLRSTREIGMMREAGRLVAEALALARSMVAPGARTGDIDQAVEELYAKHDAIPLFKNYPNPNGKHPFPAVTCISVNEEIVHGIPGDRVLQEGDIVSIDTGCKLNDWCGDSAITVPVGKLAPEVQRLVDTTKQTLEIAIEEMAKADTWTQVAREMEKFVKETKLSIVEDFVGHGIGRNMHEEPQVPNFVSKQLRLNDFPIRKGLVIAVEPMVNLGSKEVELLDDHWTVVTRDRKPSAHFEHTIAMVADHEPQVLTTLED